MRNKKTKQELRLEENKRKRKLIRNPSVLGRYLLVPQYENTMTIDLQSIVDDVAIANLRNNIRKIISKMLFKPDNNPPPTKETEMLNFDIDKIVDKVNREHKERNDVDLNNLPVVGASDAEHLPSTAFHRFDWKDKDAVIEKIRNKWGAGMNKLANRLTGDCFYIDYTSELQRNNTTFIIELGIVSGQGVIVIEGRNVEEAYRYLTIVLSDFGLKQESIDTDVVWKNETYEIMGFDTLHDFNLYVSLIGEGQLTTDLEPPPMLLETQGDEEWTYSAISAPILGAMMSFHKKS